LRRAEDKVKAGDIKSAAGRVKWAQTPLEHHLIPAFGNLLLHHIRHADIAKWRVQVAETIAVGAYSPHTANGWLDVLRVILKAAVMQQPSPLRFPAEDGRFRSRSALKTPFATATGLTKRVSPKAMRRMFRAALLAR
jgi:hypothetical protein